MYGQNKYPSHSIATAYSPRTTSTTFTKPKTIVSRTFKQSDQPAELKISKHANDRLIERNIHISDAEWAHVTEKVNEAKLKGVKESLVLMDQAALIVSAKNSTVITAMDRMEAKDQLFTNIDGTIVLS